MQKALKTLLYACGGIVVGLTMTGIVLKIKEKPSYPVSHSTMSDIDIDSVEFHEKLMKELQDISDGKVKTFDVSYWLPYDKKKAAEDELNPFKVEYGSVPDFINLPIDVQVNPWDIEPEKSLAPNKFPEIKDKLVRKGIKDIYGGNHEYAQPNFVPQSLIKQRYADRIGKPIKMMVIDTMVQPHLKPSFMKNINWHVIPSRIDEHKRCLSISNPWIQAHGSKVAWVASSAFWRMLPDTQLDIYNLPFTYGCGEQVLVDDFVSALKVADEMDMDIINISLALSEPYLIGSCPANLQETIDDLGKKGRLIIVAAGNYGTPFLFPPASCKNLLVVGNDQESSSTGGMNRDNFVYTQGTVQVPAWKYKTTIDALRKAQEQSTWSPFQGTSASAGITSGVVATWLSLQSSQCRPTWKALQTRIKDASRTLGKDVDDLSWLGGVTVVKDHYPGNYPSARASGDISNVRVLDAWLLLGVAPDPYTPNVESLWPNTEDESLCATDKS